MIPMPNQHWFERWQVVIVSLLLTLLIVVGFVLNGIRITNDVEKHIDQTIADTVKKATSATPDPRVRSLFKQVQEICQHTPGCVP